jgi:MFS family permease
MHAPVWSECKRDYIC